MPKLSACSVGLGVLLLVASVSLPVLADGASWIAVTSGAGSIAQEQHSRQLHPTLQLEAGMGTDPHSMLVFGGLAKTVTQFGAGTDLVLAQRTTTSGFSLGSWGAALDLGAYQRSWGKDSYGFHGALVAGLPWGVNVGATAALGTADARSFYLTLGFDWARLTAHREGNAWWPSYPLPLSESDFRATR